MNLATAELAQKYGALCLHGFIDTQHTFVCRANYEMSVLNFVDGVKCQAVDKSAQNGE